MDITKKIEELEQQKAAFEKMKAEAHEGIKACNTKIGKLKTIAKHAGELFETTDQAPATKEETEDAVTGI